MAAVRIGDRLEDLGVGAGVVVACESAEVRVMKLSHRPILSLTRNQPRSASVNFTRAPVRRSAFA